MYTGSSHYAANRILNALAEAKEGSPMMYLPSVLDDRESWVKSVYCRLFRSFAKRLADLTPSTRFRDILTAWQEQERDMPEAWKHVLDLSRSSSSSLSAICEAMIKLVPAN